MSPRDLECLYDETVHLQQWEILQVEEVDTIRAKINDLAENNSCAPEYNSLIIIPDRPVVDLSNNPRRKEWLLDAYEHLYRMDLIVEQLRKTITSRSLELLDVDFDLLSQSAEHALNLSVQTLNALENHHFPWTLRELTEARSEDLLSIDGFGEGGLADVKDELQSHNLKLSDD